MSKLKTTKSTLNYNKVRTLCLVIMLICLAAFILTYAFGWHDAQVFSLGAFSISGLFVTALYPIKSE